MNIQVEEQTVSRLTKWFDDYTGGFNYREEDMQRNIDIKIHHTHRVVEEILLIGREAGLTDDELRLARIIALFHDVGRFEQYRKYRTFSDKRSENHAELGVRILKEKKVLKELDARTSDMVFCAVSNHNKLHIPAGTPPECSFFSGLIRDADKLDIWKVLIDHYYSDNGRANHALVLELPETPGISKEVHNSLMNREVVRMEHVKNVNDIKLLQVGWIYDINFEPTFQCILERGYLEKLRNVLPETEEIEEVFREIDRHMEQRLGE